MVFIESMERVSKYDVSIPKCFLEDGPEAVEGEEVTGEEVEEEQEPEPEVEGEDPNAAKEKTEEGAEGKNSCWSLSLVAQQAWWFCHGAWFSLSSLSLFLSLLSLFLLPPLSLFSLSLFCLSFLSLSL